MRVCSYDELPIGLLIFVRSTLLFGILLADRSSTVASIWPLSIAFIAAPEALAFLMTFVMYVAAVLHVAVAARSWNGLYFTSAVVAPHVPVLLVPMSAWPFLFDQKPIVPSPPTGPQMCTVRL